MDFAPAGEDDELKLIFEIRNENRFKRDAMIGVATQDLKELEVGQNLLDLPLSVEGTIKGTLTVDLHLEGGPAAAQDDEDPEEAAAELEAKKEEEEAAETEEEEEEEAEADEEEEEDIQEEEAAEEEEEEEEPPEEEHESGDDESGSEGEEEEEDESEEEDAAAGAGEDEDTGPQLSEVGLIGGQAVRLQGAFAERYIAVNRNMRVRSVKEASEGELDHSAFIPIPHRFIKLQNEGNKERFLGHKNGKLCARKGGDDCLLEIIRDKKQGIVLHFVDNPCTQRTRDNVGILPNARAKELRKTGQGKHGRYRVSILNPDGERVVGNDADPFKTLQHGSKVCLTSLATGKRLRIEKSGKVSGNGGFGKWAQFHVHVCREARFRCAEHENQFLRIKKDGNVDCRGTGGGWTVFDLEDAGPDALRLIGHRYATEVGGDYHHLEDPKTGDDAFNIVPVDPERTNKLKRAIQHKHPHA